MQQYRTEHTKSDCAAQFETDMIDEALESKRQENIDKEIKAKAELFL
eukprot:SAG31_NODE_1104_length_9889_cov_4.328396_7_plen_47_part_00